jgi:hypothetical protein
MIHLLEIIRLSDFSSPLFYPSLLGVGGNRQDGYQPAARHSHPVSWRSGTTKYFIHHRSWARISNDNVLGSTIIDENRYTLL